MIKIRREPTVIRDNSMITKTIYLSYCQCPKHFWFDKNRPDLAAAPDPTSQRRLRAGQEVDKRARAQFPNGVQIPYRPHPKDMGLLASEAIASGAETLFQATFYHEDLLVKVDILTKTEIGWHLIEVKSSTKYKQTEHLPDVAFQVYVLQRANIHITQVSLMHLNSDCLAPNLDDLFALTDITEEVADFLPQIEEDVNNIRHLSTLVESPDVQIGRHCTRPYACPFYNHCWQDVDGLTIYDIPRLNATRERPLQESDVLYLADIPSDYPLTNAQQKFVDFIVQEQVTIDRETIQQLLAELEYPLYFFDFETIDYAIPRFDGCKPYQQVPFQYSCHILQEDGTLTHEEFLHMDRDDPRRPLVESLVSHIGETGHIIAYNIPFERGVLNHLASQFPEYEPRLSNMADRLWDQLPIFRKHFRHYGFGKSNSLKSVLPIVVPELSYKMLDVQDGGQAQVVWEEMIREGETAVKLKLAEELRAYCRLDTLAMVEIHKKLTTL